MLLLGITGSINHGKTSLAIALAEQSPTTSKHYSSFELIAKVADSLNANISKIPSPNNIYEINQWLSLLPTILKQQVNCKCTFSQLKLNVAAIKTKPADYEKLFVYLKSLENNPDLKDQEITKSNKSYYRPFLQWLGGYLHQTVSPNIWFSEMIRLAEKDNRDGVEICTFDGIRYPNEAELVRSIGGIIIAIKRPDFEQKDITDPTEAQRQLIVPDIIVINNARLSDLNALAKRLIRDLKSNLRRKSYVSGASS